MKQVRSSSHWERSVNPEDFELVNRLLFVFLPSSFRLYARGDGGASTTRDEACGGQSRSWVGRGGTSASRFADQQSQVRRLQPLEPGDDTGRATNAIVETHAAGR
jgi:hypothetical protein